MKKIINIGIVAHVDAGKTSLTESLYSRTHLEYQKGSIKNANTVTDTLDLEKERGITIKTASVSLNYMDAKINLIDMPGHIEFFGEVVRALNVIDVAILVVSSVGQLPTQTRRIFDTLKEAGIPTIFFINKVDLPTAEPEKIIQELYDKCSSQLLIMDEKNKEVNQDLIIEQSEMLLEKFMNDAPIIQEDLDKQLNEQLLEAKIYPVYLGSAVTSQGVKKLLTDLAKIELKSQMTEEVSAYLYKISYLNNQKQAFFKLLSGTIKRYDTYSLNESESIKVSRLLTLKDNLFEQTDLIETGEIFMLPNADKLMIGDYIGKKPSLELTLPEPTLKLTFDINQVERMILLDLLTEMTTEDPLLNVKIDEKTSEISVTIFGRVQREYIEETLRRKYSFESLTLSLPKIVYQEELKQSGVGCIEVDEALNPYWATMTLSVTPNDNQGICFESLVTTGYLKQSFQRAIETSVYESIKTGLYDYELINITVTLTGAEFFSPVSTPSEFRKLTPYALYKALLAAETVIVEPVIEMLFTSNKKYLGKIIGELGKLEARIIKVKELKDEVKVKARLAQSDFLMFEENLNEMFKAQAYVTGKVVSHQPVSDHTLYQQGKVDRIKSLLIKE